MHPTIDIPTKLNTSSTFLKKIHTHTHTHTHIHTHTYTHTHTHTHTHNTHTHTYTHTHTHTHTTHTHTYTHTHTHTHNTHTHKTHSLVNVALQGCGHQQMTPGQGDFDNTIMELFTGDIGVCKRSRMKKGRLALCH